MPQKIKRKKETKKLSINMVGKSVEKICKILKEKESKLLSEGFVNIVVGEANDHGWYREVLVGEKYEPLEDFERRVSEWSEKQIEIVKAEAECLKRGK